ncbi:hypothetical protein CERSUDRAFT_114055 [Gelatoporia subvermispora B]|uniref:Uncharacterized protein n=1 Tax=Ceriporiopsis subvermispora (strain B) TaxID=914234 RepID=M2QK40_CERS8|nr:hypothetical protein CERSUDRAFT_114055 [Gelatoporia subvermispora B]
MHTQVRDRGPDERGVPAVATGRTQEVLLARGVERLYGWASLDVLITWERESARKALDARTCCENLVNALRGPKREDAEARRERVEGSTTVWKSAGSVQRRTAEETRESERADARSENAACSNMSRTSSIGKEEKTSGACSVDDMLAR